MDCLGLGTQATRACSFSYLMGDVWSRADERMISHVFGVHDDKTLEQFNDVASRAERAALMADGHLGYVMPIGGVAAYRNRVSPIGVGVDIGCGNAAIRTDLIAEALMDDLPDLADEIFDTIAFGPGMSNSCDDAPKYDPLFEDSRWAVIPRKHRGNLQGKSRGATRYDGWWQSLRGRVLR